MMDEFEWLIHFDNFIMPDIFTKMSSAYFDGDGVCLLFLLRMMHTMWSFQKQQQQHQ